MIIFVLNLSFVFIHSTKFLFSKTDYFNMQKTRSEVLPFIHKNTNLIFTSERLFGVFVDFFNNKYFTKSSENIYMLFPFPDAGPTKSQFENAKNFLNIELNNLNEKDVIFGSKKITSSIDRKNKNISLVLNGNFQVFIKYKNILFEDKENIFFSSKNILIKD